MHKYFSIILTLIFWLAHLSVYILIAAAPSMAVADGVANPNRQIYQIIGLAYYSIPFLYLIIKIILNWNNFIKNYFLWISVAISLITAILIAVTLAMNLGIYPLRFLFLSLPIFQIIFLEWIWMRYFRITHKH